MVDFRHAQQRLVLYPYQQRVVTANPTHLALFFEMRLGKQITFLRWAAQKRPAKVLIVAPLSVFGGWHDEICRETRLPPAWLVGDALRRATTAAKSSHKHFLINPDGLRAVPQIGQLPWDVVCLDESTFIKSPKSQINQLCRRLFQNVPHRAILTGEPAPEGPLDLFEQMAFCFGSFMGQTSFFHFRHRHFVKLDAYSWWPRPGALGKIRTCARLQAFYLTRAQAGVGSKKVHQRRVVQMPAPAHALYQQAEEDFALSLPDGREIETQWAITKAIWLHRIAGGFLPDTTSIAAQLHTAKTDELLSLLKGELRNQQVVVWFHFNQELAAVAARLKKERIPFEFVNGLVPPGERHARRLRFQQGRARVFLLQIACGRFGLDLSSSSTAIIYSNSWKYEDRLQLEDRIIHVKKTEPVLYIDLVTADTVDEDISTALRGKKMSAAVFRTDILERLRDRFAIVAEEARER